MAMIALPPNLPPMACSTGATGVRGQIGVDLRELLREKWGIDIKVVEIEKIGHFCRLSFAVFNTQADVNSLSNSVLSVVKSNSLQLN